MEVIKEFIIVLALMGIVDYIWLKYFMMNYWSKMVNNIQLTPFIANTSFALPVYILMVISVLVFVLPNINKEHLLKDRIIYGGLMGLIIYGIFDFTNKVIFTKYDISLALLDISWGTFLFILVTYLSKKTLIYLENLI